MTDANTLLAALDAVANDAERAMILRGASKDTREQLAGLLAYRQLLAPNAALANFKRKLSAATTDAARLALLRGGSPTVIAALANEVSWSGLSANECGARYVAMVSDRDSEF